MPPLPRFEGSPPERVARRLARASRLFYAFTPMRKTPENVGGWSRHWAQAAPDQPAVVDGERRFSYAQFEDRVARAAGWLRERGVGAGDRVALLLGNRSAMLELVLAAARIGALSVPINSRLSPRELAFQLDDCRPALLASEGALAEVVETACDRSTCPPRSRIALSDEPDDPYEQEMATARPCAPEPLPPDAPMMLLYTSGTTGEPKGAILPHRKTLYNALNAQRYFGIRRKQERVLVAVPLFHSLGLKILSLPILYSGGTLVLHRRFDPAAFWRDVEAEQITYSGGVPTQYRRLLDVLGDRDRRAGRESLRFLFTAGAAIAPEMVQAYERHGIVLKQGFGQTETSILCCLHEDDALERAGSVGRPVVHAEVQLVDPGSCDGPPETWRRVSPQEVGEIVVRGPITMLGYWERPEATAATLRDGWLRTGDLATQDEAGFVTLTGRARDLYISGGENVYPAEVEQVLAEHPAIREVAVIGIRDPEWGESGCAHAVLEEGMHLELDALLRWAADRLAPFKLPRTLVLAGSLPRTASGKVRKHELSRGRPEPRA